jgi:hypothetical protein
MAATAGDALRQATTSAPVSSGAWLAQPRFPYLNGRQPCTSDRVLVLSEGLNDYSVTFL